MKYICIAGTRHHMVGMEVSAQFLQLLAENFQLHYNERARIQDNSDGDAVLKQCPNLATLLCYLYNFKVVHSSVLIDLMKKLALKSQEVGYHLDLREHCAVHSIPYNLTTLHPTLQPYTPPCNLDTVPHSLA